MTTPDWQEISKLKPSDHNYFRSERFDGYIRDMYREIIEPEDRDNMEVKSIWLRTVEDNHFAKSDFLAFILSSREDDEHRPIDWKDVLRYFRKKQIDGEFEQLTMKSMNL